MQLRVIKHEAAKVMLCDLRYNYFFVYQLCSIYKSFPLFFPL